MTQAASLLHRTEHVGEFVDMYNEDSTTTWHGRSGPAYALNGSCDPGGDPENDGWPPSGECGMTGPLQEYEEYKFKLRNLEIINGHDATDGAAPLFLWCA